MNPYYKEYSDYLSEFFEGKVQKLPLDAGFTCPNRDGTLGRGGCTYCNNSAFSPDTGARRLDVGLQLEDAGRFFGRKYKDMRYLAYFQSYTNSYGDPDYLMKLYGEALSVDGVAGLVIATRPDCMPDSLLERLSVLNRRNPVFVEYGAESSHDATLRAVNRCHTWADTVSAVTRTSAAGLQTGLHLILGLPGETRKMMLQTVDRVNDLPVNTVKFHQLQILKGTRLAADYEAGRSDVRVFSAGEYADLCAEIVVRLRKDIAIERFVSQSPDNMLIAPRWGLKPGEFTKLIHERLALMTAI